VSGARNGRSVALRIRAASAWRCAEKSAALSAAWTAFPKAVNSSHVISVGAVTRTRSETTPKWKIRADTSASIGHPSTTSRLGPSETDTGGVKISIAWASARLGRARSGALDASSSSARSSWIS
jgi:hypothetical protein